MADGMRFDFLYDRRRRIFAIGYRLEDASGPGRLDGSFYDLLASEARLASFVAIAKGDVPQHHWFHLGRLVTNVDGRATLMSWGGTMFEYLMPQLLMRSFPGTLLDQSCRASVRRQIEYGRQRAVPWGISESAYAFTDREGNYQYRAFGVPGLGLKRGLATDLVIAPYASALASLVSPAAAAQNFEALAQAGLDARYGFYESLDYNPAQSRCRTGRAARGAEAAGPGAGVLRASPGHVARRARQRRPAGRVRLAVPRRPADPGDRAALAGAGAARGHPVRTAPRRGRNRPADAARLCVAELPHPAHPQRAHAFPVERPLHDRPHERRRRLQHVARHGRHSPSRGSDVGRRRALHLLARPVVEARVVGNAPADRAGARPVRRGVRAGQGHVSAAATAISRRSSRSPCRPRTMWRSGG